MGNDARTRVELMAKREDFSQQFWKAVASWREEDLDRYVLPHPLLGKLTLREMLCFTLYHNYHHVRNVATRLQGATSDSTS